MTNQLTQEQIQWAKSHDWFEAETKSGCIVVMDNYTFAGKSYGNPIVWVKSFKELREWAGY